MKKKLLIGLSFLLFLLLIAFAVGVNYFWGIKERKAFIEQEMSSMLHRPVVIQKAMLQIFPRIMVVLHQVEIKERGGKSDFISLKKVHLGISFRHLFARMISCDYLVLDQPRILLSRKPKEGFNVSDLVEDFSFQKTRENKKEHWIKEFKLSLKNFIIREGEIEFKDYAISESPVSLTVTALNLQPGKPSRKGLLPIFLEGVLKSVKNETRIDIKGEIEPIIEDSKLTAIRFVGDTRFGDLSLSCFEPYLCAWKNINALQGTIKGKFSFQGIIGGDFKAGAELDVVSLKIKNEELLKKELWIDKAHLQCSLNREKRNWILSPIKIKLPGLTANGKVSVDTTPTPVIDVEIETGNFDYQAILPSVPFFLFSPGVKDFLTEKVMSGKVDNLFLHYSKKFPQAPSDKKISTISGNLCFRDFSLKVIDETPWLEHLNGNARFENRDITVTDLTGTFGNSLIAQTAFTISESTGLNFSGDFKLDLSEMNNLIHLNKIPPDILRELEVLQSMNGKALLALKASGPLNNLGALAFEGKLMLIDADIDYRNFCKPAKKVNGTFQFTPDIITITDVTGWWANSPFTCRGEIKDYRSAEKSKIYVHVAFENADINDLASAFFPWKEVHGEGSVKIFIDFNCLGYQSQNLRFQGESSFKDLTLIFPAFPYPFNNTEGKIGFSSDGLTFPHIKFQTGSSDIAFSGMWKGLSKPKLKGKIKGNFVNFLDFYKPRKGEEEKPVKFTLEKITLNVKQGVYKKLVVDDLETEISSHEETFFFSSPRAARGKLRDFAFVNLNTIQENQSPAATYHQGVIQIPFLKLESGKGYWIGKDISLPVLVSQPERFSLASEIKDLSTKNFLKMFPKKNQKLSGRLNLKGTVTGNGKTLPEWMNTLKGEVSFTTEKGKVQELTILSKLFSLLNVSRIFSQDYLKLLSSGMPYDTIQSTFTIDEGIARTDGILLNSPAMKMNGVGDINLGKETLDMEVAVQPLETVDKVVGKIPILGTILKGEQGAVVVTYYKVTGTFENPEWKTMVFGSLGRKGQSIFKQIFKLPETILNWSGKNNSENKNQDVGDKKK
ncbi:MAG TPA: AsmA-like C-terminal domain-containing protein [Thermodesulfobacteriota bacterium]|nr:AsmA-like C-terminal domain-containing protein [Thermodesulfobacteriota bacterium]